MFFTSVIGDGVRYALVKLSKRGDGGFAVEVSPAFEFALGATPQPDVAFQFFTLCVHAVQLSASGKWVYRCGWSPEPRWPAAVQVSEVLAASETIVFRYFDANRERKIAKMARTVVHVGVQRLSREIEQRNVVATRAAQHVPPINVDRIFLPATEQALCGHRALVFDDVGLVSFESLVHTMSATQVQRLAVLVWSQLRKRLALLHELRMAFGDVHVGNILISSDLQRAVLVDCESICEFDEPLVGVLLRPMFRPLVDVASAESDLESLRYCVAWALDIESFRTGHLARNRYSGTAEMWNTLKKKITVDVVERTLEAIEAERLAKRASRRRKK